MISTVAARLFMLLSMVWAAATLNFFVPRLTGTNPIEERLAEIAGQGGGSMIGVEEMIRAYTERFGLDRPLWQQYLDYLYSVMTFDLGYSIANYPARVGDMIAAALPWTIGLLGTTTLISFAIGSLLGALAVWPKAPAIFRRSLPFQMVLAATPFYLVALVIVYVFAFRLQWFPNGGGHALGAQREWSPGFFLDVLYHSLLPAFAIVIASMGTWAVGMRGMMVNIQGEDYMNFAEAKGLKPRRVFLHYGVRNAILPQLTAVTMSFGQLITGSVLVEMVFNYPGVGSLMFQAVRLSDFFTIYGCVLILVLVTGVAMLLLDLLSPLLDPRIQVRRA
jgi:peptide/nickel transport system permease protein